MFSPVSGPQLQQFDEETRRLYAKRESDPRLTANILTLRRPGRHHLPVIAPNDHPTVKEREEYLAWFPYKLMAGTGFFIYACT